MLARGAQGEVIPRWEGVTFSFLLHTFPKHNTHMHAAVNGDCVALKFKDTLEDSHLRARTGREERERSNKTTSPLSSVYLGVGVRGASCRVFRGFSVESLRERGERDAEIEVCLLSGNPINQHVNTLYVPFFPRPSERFLKGLGSLTRGADKFSFFRVFTFYGCIRSMEKYWKLKMGKQN